MKNRTTVLVFVLMTVLVVTACAQQYDPESDFRVEPVDGGKSVRITKYVGNKMTVRIPPLIQKLPVSDIGRVFSGNRNITSVTIPNSVTSIVNNAFSGCHNLASITIPNGVTSIGQNAFNGCLNLSGITIPASVTRIENGAFGSCRSLTNVTIPNSVTSIESFAFQMCSSLTSITIPSSVINIGGYAFQMTSLTNVTFQGTIAADKLGSNDISGNITSPFAGIGDLRDKYLAGGIGTYTTTEPVGENSVWTKQ